MEGKWNQLDAANFLRWFSVKFMGLSIKEDK